MCTYFRQLEVLTRAEWILVSTGDAGPTFHRHWIRVCLHSVDTPPPTESTVQYWMVDVQSRRRWTSVEPALGWRVVFAGHSVLGDTGPLSYLANTGYSHNAVSLSAHRLRRWPNIETALGEWPVFARYYQPLSCGRGDISSFCLQKTVKFSCSFFLYCDFEEETKQRK